jgi:hypothetical protein
MDSLRLFWHPAYHNDHGTLTPDVTADTLSSLAGFLISSAVPSCEQLPGGT